MQTLSAYTPGQDHVKQPKMALNINMFPAVIVVLACASLIVDGYPFKRDDKCESLKRCTDSPGALGDLECWDFIDNVECVENCDSESIRRLNSYTCSNEGRDAIKKLATSECATNRKKKAEMYYDIHFCFEKSQEPSDLEGSIYERDMHPEQLCQVTNCTDILATVDCGQEYADFLANVVNYLIKPQLDQLYCAQILSENSISF